MKVDFFIPGVGKCGTTALGEYLGQHPRVCMAVPKEPAFFAEDFAPMRYVTTLQDYEALFSCPGKTEVLRGDASPQYLSSRVALPLIHAYNPDAKLIVMLRDPADVVFSMHAQLVFSLFEDETDFETAWRLQELRRRGERIPPKCRLPSALQYRELVRYPQYLERLFAAFPKEQVKIILFDDFIADTASVYAEVLAFLGLEPFEGVDLSVRNPRKRARSAWLNTFLHSPPGFLRSLLDWTGKGRLHGAIVRLHGWLRDVNSEAVEGEVLSEDMRRELREVFRAEVEATERIIGRDLSAWR